MIKRSIVVPVYRNEGTLLQLIEVLGSICTSGSGTEVVFVVDGSPDRSYLLLRDLLPTQSFRSKLVRHSRNFGAFAAIRTGLFHCSGEYFGVMAADLQEPPELITQFFSELEHGDVDIVVGTRSTRQDPLGTKFLSSIFWRFYKRFVISDMPKGGVDMFACNRLFREHLLKLNEANSSLIGLIFWMGFRRKVVPYERKARLVGKSAWTLRKKVDYFLDSLFAFSSLPVNLLLVSGGVGILVSWTLSLTVICLRLIGNIPVPGYSATVIIVLFFAGLNCLGLGIIGTYAWRTYENSKQRPLSLVLSSESF